MPEFGSGRFSKDQMLSSDRPNVVRQSTWVPGRWEIWHSTTLIELVFLHSCHLYLGGYSVSVHVLAMQMLRSFFLMGKFQD